MDMECLLTDKNVNNPSQIRFNVSNNNNNSSRWRKNAFLLLISFFIASCLTVYLYLNMIAINSNQQPDPSSRYKVLSRRKPILDHESIYSDSGPSMIKLSDLLAHCIVGLRLAGHEVVKLSLAHNDKLQQVGSKGKTLEGIDDVVTGADLKSHHMILTTIKDSYRRLNVVSEEDSTKGFENAKDEILPIERAQFAQMLRNDLNQIEDQQADRGSLIALHDTLVWIDPLDATKEYSENLTDYVTLMACVVHKSVPIAGVIFKPFTNKTYWSMKDVSTGEFYHSTDLKNLLNEAYLYKQQQGETLRIVVSRSHAGDVKNVLGRFYGDQANIISAGGSGYKTVELISGRADAYMHMTHIKKWDICSPHAILNSLPAGQLTDLDGEQISFGDPNDKVVTRGLIASLDQKIHQELINSTRTFKGN